MNDRLGHTGDHRSAERLEAGLGTKVRGISMLECSEGDKCWDLGFRQVHTEYLWGYAGSHWEHWRYGSHTGRHLEVALGTLETWRSH